MSSDTSTSIGVRSDSFDPTLDHHSVACSGAITSNVNGALGSFRELPQIDQGYLNENTTLVTLTIGRNDIGFADVLEQCVVHGVQGASSSCANIVQDDGFTTLQQTTNLKLAALDDRVLGVLSDIQTAAPNASILLLGYPPMFHAGTTCLGMASIEQFWLNDVSLNLNETLRVIAGDAHSTAHPVFWGDPTNAYYDHAVCAADPAITRLLPYAPNYYGNRSAGDRPIFVFPQIGPDFTLGVSQQSVHPNNLGTDLYSDVMEDALLGNY